MTICAVYVVLPGKWPEWYLAKIVDDKDDENLSRVQVIGETFARDTWNDAKRIADPVLQAAAQRLAKRQWVPTGYAKADDLRNAIRLEAGETV